jgi:hypothetical protein
MKICKDCQHECEGELIDVGIGPYEFWGAKGCDSRMSFVSECCEADVVDENGNPVDYDPPEPDCDEDDAWALASAGLGTDEDYGGECERE